jgi:hypothetical protein
VLQLEKRRLPPELYHANSLNPPFCVPENLPKRRRGFESKNSTEATAQRLVVTTLW